MKPKITIVSVLLAALAGLSHAAAPEQDENPTEPAQSFNVGYKADLLRNTRGGISTGGGALGHLDIQWKADLARLLNWNNTTAFVNFIDDRGNHVNADRVGSLLGVSNIEVPRATYRLLHAWVQQRYVNGQLGVLLGLYPVDSEFAVMESAGLFVQPPYGAWADYAVSAGPSIFNTSSFGTRLHWQASESGAYGLLAVLDGRPGDPDHPIGTHVRFAPGDGTQTVAELGYKPEAAKGDTASGSSEHFEKYMIGYWRYTTHDDDLVDVDAAGDPIKRRSAGGYLAAERTLYANGGGASVTAFGRYSFNNGDTLPIARTLNLGLRLRGLTASRPDDLVGIAYTRAATGAKFRAAQAAAGIEATSFEDAIEVTYRSQLTPSLAVQPFIQAIRHPGADAALATAWPVGVRIELSF